MHRAFVAPLCAFILLAACAGADTPRPTPSPAAETAAVPSVSPTVAAAFARDALEVLPAGGAGTPIRLFIEIPTTQPAYQQGLMGRAPLPDSEGMLFVMVKQPGCVFWMKDTPSPLSIAFADAEGRIVAIRDMQAFSTELTFPPAPCAYALEVAQRWFERHGVKPGDLLRFSWPLTAPPPYPN
ncbi:MAG: DUF192 domain-containing protein [Dehalococcoidia bacterium]|nr:DUF192 domain-containing protein [Dehalococcoidia bacterium]